MSTLAAAVDVRELGRALREVLPASAKAAGARSLPVTGNVLVEARPGRLRLTCFNLSAQIDQSEACRMREVPALVVEAGAVSVPARLLKDLAKELRAGQVEIATDGDHLLAQYRPLSLTCRFKAIELEEWPPLYRDIDLGDWAFLPDGLEVAA